MNKISIYRINFVFIALFALFFVLFFRALFLYGLGDDLKSKSSNKVEKKSARYEILDRNGKILATDLITYTLYGEPSTIRSLDKVIGDLSKFFPKHNWKSVNKKLSNKKFLGRVLLIRDLTPKQRYEINSLGHVGLYFHEDNKRFYPHKNILSHVLGFVDREEHGLSGFEGYFGKSSNKADFIQDDQVTLSIDLQIQNITHQELSYAVKKFSAKGGVALVMNASNSEIYSLVSLPDFNPYDPGESLRNKNYNNKASYDLHEMGSTFKIFTMALALENNLIELDEMLDVSENIKISGYKIKDFKKIKEDISIRDVFVRSSNIGTTRIAQKFSEEQQKEFFNKLHLFEPLEVELVEKSYSKIPRRWGLTRKITASYGYGVSVSALHLNQAIAAIVNQGHFLPATLIKGKNNMRIPEKIISDKTSAQVRELLGEVVSRGTARRAYSKGYRIGGKTGSANKIGRFGYDEDRLLSSFVGVFPVDKPKFIVYAFLDEPNGIAETGGYATGGATAAPVVKNIIERMAPLYNIVPDEEY